MNASTEFSYFYWKNTIMKALGKEILFSPYEWAIKITGEGSSLKSSEEHILIGMKE